MTSKTVPVLTTTWPGDTSDLDTIRMMLASSRIVFTLEDYVHVPQEERINRYTLTIKTNPRTFFSFGEEGQLRDILVGESGAPVLVAAWKMEDKDD